MRPWMPGNNLSPSQMIVVTGASGFIGQHLVKELLSRGYMVVGIDIHDSPLFSPNYIHVKGDMYKHSFIQDYLPSTVYHLAGLAGVRESLQDPEAYMKNNVLGFVWLLEECKRWDVKHLCFASSSSVYGDATPPFTEATPTDQQLSPYAVTKKTMELCAAMYRQLYDMKITAFRFFTVFGEGCRRNMFPRRCLESILRGTPITVFGDGSSQRDYTYVGDIVNAIVNHKNAKEPVYNLCSNRPVQLLEFIRLCEEAAGKKATIVYTSEQKGDVSMTHGDNSLAVRDLGFSVSPLAESIQKTFLWIQQNV